MKRYPDKSWKKNQLSKLKAEDCETIITQPIYDCWNGHSNGVFKAMKIAFIPIMADNLVFTNRSFASLVINTVQDFTTTTNFCKQVVALSVATGFTFEAVWKERRKGKNRAHDVGIIAVGERGCLFVNNI